MAFISMFPRFKVAVPALADCSWAQIASYANAGLAADVWNIGDIKTIAINGVSYTAVIVGFNHDDLADGSGKAGITFSLGECLPTTRSMNSTATSAGGWEASGMRSYLNDTVLDQMPTDLLAVIKSVNKLSNAGALSSAIVTTADELFLFSEIECFGTNSYSYAGEGTQYDYFTSNTVRIRKVGTSANFWWLRGSNKSTSSYFCGVNSNGTAGRNNANTALGVCFGFCV